MNVFVPLLSPFFLALLLPQNNQRFSQTERPAGVKPALLPPEPGLTGARAVRRERGAERRPAGCSPPPRGCGRRQGRAPRTTSSLRATAPRPARVRGHWRSPPHQRTWKVAGRPRSASGRSFRPSENSWGPGPPAPEAGLGGASEAGGLRRRRAGKDGIGPQSQACAPPHLPAPPTPPRERQPPAEVLRRALPGVVWPPPPRVSCLRVAATARLWSPGRRRRRRRRLGSRSQERRHRHGRHQSFD